VLVEPPWRLWVAGCCRCAWKLEIWRVETSDWVL